MEEFNIVGIVGNKFINMSFCIYKKNTLLQVYLYIIEGEGNLRM